MITDRRQLIREAIAIAVVIGAGFIMKSFLLPLAWAGILAIATWPFYMKIHRALNHSDVGAASLATAAIVTIIGVPLLALGMTLGAELHNAARLLNAANAEGWPAPDWVARLPYVGTSFSAEWNSQLGHPHGVAEVIHTYSAGRITSLSELLRNTGVEIARRTIVLGFSILALFFFYRDGPALVRQLNAVGEHWLAERWSAYFHGVPNAIRATVNGLVFVGIAEGVLIGIGYGFAGAQAPVLLGAVTAVLAIIPFAAPVAFGAVAVVLAAAGHAAAAGALAVWGFLVLFVADHFVRPALIGGATKLPFLAVLFGILGGVEMLGLVGLFLGPVVMVLFITLWREAIHPGPVAP